MSLAATRLLLEWDWDGGERELKRVFELNPSIPEAASLLGYERQFRGKPGEAIGLVLKGVRVDPLSALLRTDLAAAYYYNRDWDSAIAEYEKALELDPAFVAPFFVVAQALERKGDSAGAIARCEKAIKAQGRDPSFLSALGYALARAGRHKEAMVLARELEARHRKQPFNPTVVALLYAGLGDRQRALDWLERAYKEHDVQLAWFNLEPQVDMLREEPRFVELMSRMRLVTPPATASRR